MVKTWFRDGVLVVFALVVGWWAHGGRAVQAASAGEFNYQFMSNNLNNALTIYNPQERTLYVYQGASSLGGSRINCSFLFHVARPGEPIERENCKVGAGLP